MASSVHEDRNENDHQELSTNGSSLPKNRPRRPDKQLYVPRAKRLESQQTRDKSCSASPSVQDVGDAKSDSQTITSPISPRTNLAPDNDLGTAEGGISGSSLEKATSKNRGKQKNNVKNGNATAKAGKKITPGKPPALKSRNSEKNSKLLSSSDAGVKNFSKTERSDEGNGKSVCQSNKSLENILNNTKVNHLSSIKPDILNEDSSIVGVVMKSDSLHPTESKPITASKTTTPPPNCQNNCDLIKTENFYNCSIHNDNLFLSTTIPESSKTDFDKLIVNSNKKLGINSKDFPESSEAERQKLYTDSSVHQVNKQSHMNAFVKDNNDAAVSDQSSEAALSSITRTDCATNIINEVFEESDKVDSQETEDFIQFPEISFTDSSSLTFISEDTVDTSLSPPLNSSNISVVDESVPQCCKTLLDEPFISDAEILQPVSLENAIRTTGDQQQDTVSSSPSVSELNNSTTFTNIDLDLFETEFSGRQPTSPGCQISPPQSSGFRSPYLDDLEILNKPLDSSKKGENSAVSEQCFDKSDKSSVNEDYSSAHSPDSCIEVTKTNACSHAANILDPSCFQTLTISASSPEEPETDISNSKSVFVSSELEALSASCQNNVSLTEDLNLNRPPNALIDNGVSTKNKIVSPEKPDNVRYQQSVKENGEMTAEDSWENLYSDDGDCLDPNLVKELTKIVGKVNIKKTKIDYLSFQPKEPHIGDDEFGHVIEIYDFPVEFKTQDLMAAFSSFKNRGFDIKWVDDTHALGLFASPMAAADALTTQHPFLKTRPLIQGTRESKLKARRHAEFLQPYRPRPETSASLARRLVTGALGLKVQIPKEQREKERQKLKEAKEKKKLAAKQRNDAWEGNFSST